MKRRNAHRSRTTGRNRSLRVLLVVENVPLARDHRLRKQVRALQTAGLEVSVLCPADPTNVMPGVTLYEYQPPAPAESKAGFLREYGLAWVKTGIRMLQAARGEGFDAVQIAGNPDIFFPFAWLCRRLGRPVVFDQRDPAPELFRARFGGRPRALMTLLLALERASFRTADHVLVVNQTLADTACRRGGLAAERVTVVGNGPVLAETWPRPSSQQIRKGRSYLAVWLGLMGPQDNVEALVHAVDLLVHVHGRTDCQFALVGDGEARPKLQRLAADLGVAEWVDLPGWADESLAFTYLSSADVGLEPNLEEVVSPVKIQEYMAFRLPVVAFDLPETRRLVEPAGELVPSGNVAAFAASIHELLDDAERRKLLGLAGLHKVAKHLAWDRQQEAYLAVWRQVLPDADDAAAQPQELAAQAGAR